MAEQGGWRRRLLKLVVVVPVALLGILAVYSLTSLTDGSLADLSAPVVASVAGAVLAVALLGRWLFTRRAKRRLVSHETANFGSPEIPAASWPPGKVSPLPARPTLTSSVSSSPSPAPTVASKWGTAGTPSVSRGSRMIVPGSPPKIVPAPPIVAPVVVPAAPVTANVPIAREVVSAVRSPGVSSALAEYLNGREELATLIASVEARMPSAPEATVEPAPVTSEPVPVAAEVAPAPEPVVEVVPERAPEVEPEVAPEPVAASLAAPEAAPAGEPADISAAAQNAQVLTEAVEKVTRASELIARSCALFTEAIDADRAELRALADAVMTLAQAIVPAPSPPRLVGGSVFSGRAREHDIVIDDERSETSVSAPAPASAPSEKSGSGAPRPAAATPRPSNWSAARASAAPPTSLPPKPRFPGNRSER